MTKFLALLFAFALTQASLAAEVGESSTRMDSEADDHSFLFRIEPQWLLLKELSLDFQFKLSDNFTLGPTLAYMSQGDGIFYGTKVANHLFNNDKTNRESFGVRGVYYFKGVESSSAYISGFGRFASNQVTSKYSSSYFGNNEKAEFNETSFGVTGGYQWVFGRHFTMNVGGGLATFIHPTEITLTDGNGSSRKFQLDGETLGYALDAGLGFQF